MYTVAHNKRTDGTLAGLARGPPELDPYHRQPANRGDGPAGEAPGKQDRFGEVRAPAPDYK